MPPASRPCFSAVQPNDAYLATLSEYHTFTPSLINEFRFGYNRLNQTFSRVWKSILSGLDAFPNIDVYELNAAYGPDPNAPQYTIQNLYQLTDNVTWTKGKHSFKFGFDGWSTISPHATSLSVRGATMSGAIFPTICTTTIPTGSRSEGWVMPATIRISSCWVSTSTTIGRSRQI